MTTASTQDGEATGTNIGQPTSTNKVAKKRQSKFEATYWRARLFKPSYSRDGVTKEVPHYSVRIQYRGKRDVFSLHTLNREVAALEALKIYKDIVSSGWTATLAKFKPNSIKSPGTTIGELIREIRAHSTANPRTLATYTQKLYQLASDICDIDGDKRHDLRGSGNKGWRERVEAIKLDRLTPDKINKWKVAYLKAAGTSPLKQRAARTSVNTIIRCARSLFSPVYLEHTSFKAIPNPFSTVKLEPKQSTLYHSSIDPESLIREGLNELGEEELKAFLLALTCGLRRDEIDKLTWDSFQWNKGRIVLGATESFGGKSESSLSEVNLDPELLAIFRGYYAKANGGAFVLVSRNQPKPGALYAHYRCDRIFKKLNDWLRSKGVKGNPIHTLRKEYGSLVCAKFGLYAASRALRHSNIQTTTAHYLDIKTRATAGLGHLLTIPGNVAPINPTEDTLPPIKLARNQS